jgi:hypothetical protein
MLSSCCQQTSKTADKKCGHLNKSVNNFICFDFYFYLNLNEQYDIVLTHAKQFHSFDQQAMRDLQLSTIF